jgi:hypothetical protein
MELGRGEQGIEQEAVQAAPCQPSSTTMAISAVTLSLNSLAGQGDGTTTEYA